MILKKFHFPIFILVLILLCVLSSCKKNSQNPEKSKITNNFYTLFDKAEMLYENQEYSNAFYYFNKTKLLGEALNDNNKIIYSLMRMAQIQQVQSDYFGSETTAAEAIGHFQKDTDVSYKINIYNQLGIDYFCLYNFEEALKYYNLSLQLNKDELGKAITKNNMALVYRDKKEFQKAIEILSPLANQKEVVNDLETHARIIDNLGYILFQTGNSRGLDYLNQSLSIRNKINDDYGLMASYFHLTKFYENTNSNLAKHYAIQSYKKATKIKSAEDRLETLGVIIKNSNGDELKKYSIIHINLNDSLVKAKQIAKNQFAKIKYDVSKSNEENVSLKLLEERTQTKNMLLSVTLVSLLLLSLLIYFLIQSKHKREKLLTSYTTETRIAKKLHDELANDVFQVMTYADTQDLTSEKNKEFLVNTLDTIYSRTRNISKENSSIDTGPDFVPYLKEVLSSYNSDSTTILVNGLDPDVLNALDSPKKIMLYRVINELLVNMKKHSQSSLVVISFKKVKNNLQLDYTDNGIGLSSDTFILKNGLQNVENRIIDLKGSITFDNETKKGFKVSILIPL